MVAVAPQLIDHLADRGSRRKLCGERSGSSDVNKCCLAHSAAHAFSRMRDDCCLISRLKQTFDRLKVFYITVHRGGVKREAFNTRKLQASDIWIPISIEKVVEACHVHTIAATSTHTVVIPLEACD